jgi:cytochrome c biogenesis protein CcmG, thiol:disulfide interchange protein DsbE
MVHTLPMNPLLLLLLGWVFPLLALGAAPTKFETLQVGGITYSNVTVLGFNVSDLYFSHSAGISNVKLKRLPAELQKSFEFDAQAAAEAEKKQLEEEMSYQQSIASHIQTLRAQAALAEERAAATRSSEENLADPLVPTSLLGKPAPALKVDKWLGEKPETESKAILYAFYTTWSIPCQKMLPDLKTWQKKLSSKLVVVGLGCEAEADLGSFTESTVGFPTAIDSKNQMAAGLGVSSVPSVALVDASGLVRYVGHPAALTEAKLQALLNKLAQ